jgi:hypothetical protein
MESKIKNNTVIRKTLNLKKIEYRGDLHFVNTKNHYIIKIYPIGSESSDCLLHQTVKQDFS